MNAPRILPAACLALFMPTSASGQVVRSYPVIAVQGDASPSINPGATYGILGGTPHIDASGSITFGGFVGNNGNSATYAVWTGQPGASVALVVKDDPTPGRPGGTLDVFGLSSASDYWPCADGVVAFTCETDPSGDEGIWLGVPGSLHEALIVNNAAPDLAGPSIKSFVGPDFVANGEGGIFVRATLEGTGTTADDNTALWSGMPSQGIDLIAREGEQAPGLEAGARYGEFTNSSLSMNAEGEVCFEAALKTTSNLNNSAIFAGAPGSLLPIAREGDAVPIAPGFLWGGMGKTRIDNQGNVCFEATPAPGGNRSFFLRAPDGAFTRIAEENTAAPGTGGTAWKGLFFNQPLVAGSYAAFRAGLDGGDPLGRGGIWIHSTAEGTKLVAKAGDPTPGMPGESFNTFDQPALNALGMLAFTAQTSSGRNTLWNYSGGTLELLLVDDEDMLDLGAGDVRKVSQIKFRAIASSQDGFRTGLNDSGHLSFGASFSSGGPGTGILMIDLCDRDGGGTDCLLEEAFGGNSMEANDDYSILPMVHREDDELVFTFRRRTDGSFGYLVEQSAGLDNWDISTGATAPAASQEGLPPGIERAEHRVPIHPGPNTNLRLQVTRN